MHQQTTSASLADFLHNLGEVLQEAATAARKIGDRTADLPAVLYKRHIANHQGISPTTAWRKARLGEYGPLLSGPGEPIRIDRDTYLRSLKGGG